MTGVLVEKISGQKAMACIVATRHHFARHALLVEESLQEVRRCRAFDEPPPRWTDPRMQ